MLRPQPLHQLPKLPCYVFPACARPAFPGTDNADRPGADTGVCGGGRHP